MASEEKEENEAKTSKEDTKSMKETLKEKKKTLKAQKKRGKRLRNLAEPGQQVKRAVGGGFLGVLAIVAFTYILWGIMTDDSILFAGAMFDKLSMGNGLNGLMGVWALAFTPLTSLNVLVPNWQDNWYYFLIPIVAAGFIIGVTTKKVSLALLGGVFFVFWGIVIPLILVYILPLFGLCDPTIVDGILITILKEPLDSWNYGFIEGIPLIGDNLFISWSMAGALEIGLLVTVIAIIVALPIQLIKR